MTALLLIFVFRRLSPGVVLSVMGFMAWSLSSLQILPAIGLNPALNLNLIHVIVMGKVVAAMGMILLALEDELDINKAAQERERRARRELEAYTGLILPAAAWRISTARAPTSARLWWRTAGLPRRRCCWRVRGRYRLAGSAGLDEATVTALGQLAARIPAAGFLAAGSAPSAVEQSQTLQPGPDALAQARRRSEAAAVYPGAGRAHDWPRSHRGRAAAGWNAAHLQGESPRAGPTIRCVPTTCCPSRCWPPGCRPRAARPCCLKS